MWGRVRSHKRFEGKSFFCFQDRTASRPGRNGQGYNEERENKNLGRRGGRDKAFSPPNLKNMKGKVKVVPVLW